MRARNPTPPTRIHPLNNPPRDIVALISEMARTPRNEVVRTRVATRSECHQFRRKAYTWRIEALGLLSDPFKGAEHLGALKQIYGKRLTSDWLRMLVFRLEQEPGAAGCRLVVELKEPLFGTPVEFEDEVAEDMASLTALINTQIGSDMDEPVS